MDRRHWVSIRGWAVMATVALSCGLLAAITGAAPASAAPSTPSAARAASAPHVNTTLPGYTPVTPVRICDTRPVSSFVASNQCDTDGNTTLGPGGILKFVVAGEDGVPADATAVVLHVTVTNTTAASYLTAWPTTQAIPTASNLNWSAGQTASNLVQIGVGTLGRVSVLNYLGNTDVIVDLEGYFTPDSGALFVPLTPTRVCDTRLGAPANPCNGNGATSGTLGANQTMVVNVTTAFGVPAGATAVVLNATATNTTAPSYLTIFAEGATPPLATALNWVGGQTVPNRVITAIPASGNIEVFNSSGFADVVLDLTGYFSPTVAGSGYFPLPDPDRICDTRDVGSADPDNICVPPGPLPPFGPPDFITTVLSGFDPSLTALVGNVTVTNTDGSGYLTVFPDDASQLPLASDLNWAQGQTVANLVVIDLGSTAAFDLLDGSSATTDVVIDAEGVYSATPPSDEANVRFAPTASRRASR